MRVLWVMALLWALSAAPAVAVDEDPPAQCVRIVVQMSPAKDPLTGNVTEVTDDVAKIAADIVERRLKAAVSEEFVLRLEPPDTMIVEVEEPSDVNRMTAILKRAGRLELKERLKIPASKDGKKKASWRWRTVLDGRHVKRAYADFDSGGGPFVAFEFDPFGTEVLAKVTKRNVGKVLGIFFDGRLIDSPKVMAPILGGVGRISGGAIGYDEYREMADYLNAGALPVTLSVVKVERFTRPVEKREK